MTVPQETTQKSLLAGPEILVGVPVLIVDDNPTNREILEHVTRDWRMAPCAVSDGEAALREVEVSLRRSAPKMAATTSTMRNCGTTSTHSVARISTASTRPRQ